MIYKLVVIYILGLTLCVAQNTKDVGFLKDMTYLEIVKESPNLINCDSTSGSNLEQRICLNIKLRQVDSIMLKSFNTLLDRIKKDNLITNKDSLVSVFKNQQLHWETKRKSMSMYKSNGWESNSGPILYMHSMIVITELRTKELNFLLEEY